MAPALTSLFSQQSIPVRIIQAQENYTVSHLSVQKGDTFTVEPSAHPKPVSPSESLHLNGAVEI